MSRHRAPGRAPWRQVAGRPPSGRQWIAPAVTAAVTACVLTWDATSAAFTATTDNPSSSLSAATVSLSDDDSGTALFSVSGLVPGNTATRCVLVTYTGNTAAAVKLYTTSGSASGGLGSYLTLTVDEGTGGTFSGGCTGFTSSSPLYSGTLASFASTCTTFGTGLGTFAPTSPGDTKTYRFTYALVDNNSAQGLSQAIGVTWEARNT